MKLNKIVLFTFLFVFQTSIINAQNSIEYLDAAKNISNWLSTQEIKNTSTEVAWRISNITEYSSVNITNGSAGIALFYLKLYKATNENDYLEKAVKASNHIYNICKNQMNIGPDWISGAAGCGDFMVALYKVTGNSVYLEKAKYFADYLNKTKYEDDGGYYWKRSPTFPKTYTGFAHGAAGISYFFLNLYQVSNDPIYLKIAEKSFKWLEHYTIEFNGDALGWKRLTTDDFAYHQWCGGTVGIMRLLDKMISITNKSIYKEYLRKSANGLIENAIQITDDEYSWYYTTNVGSFPIIYCHGTSSLASTLMFAYKILEDNRYLEVAQKGNNWINEVKKTYTENEFYWAHIYEWDQFDTGLLTGTAGVGDAMLESYSIYSDQEYLDLAIGAAQYLLSIAESKSEDQLCWINYTNSENSGYDEKQYFTGWYSGAAGIGIFFIDLYNTLNQTYNNEEYSAGFKLYQNYPNPFNPTTNIRYNIPCRSTVNLTIYNVIGQKIKVLVNEVQNNGNYEIQFNGSGFPNGMYLYSLEAGNYSETKKLILLK